MRLRILLAARLAVTLASSVVRAVEDLVRVDIPMIVSGAGAQFGESIVQGAPMYADEVNAAGSVLGRKIEIIARGSEVPPRQGCARSAGADRA